MGNWKVVAIAAGSLVMYLDGCALGGQVEHANVSIDISADGKRLVFSAADGDLYVWPLGANRVTRLTRSEATDSTPAFSPVGNLIAYASTTDSGKGRSIYVRSIDGKKARGLTSTTAVYDGSPSFSRDGKWIVFDRGHKYRPYSMGGYTWDDFDVYVIRTDGSGLRRLTNEKYRRVGRPRFARDGRTILYAADVPYDGKYFKKDMGGSMTTLIEVAASGAGKPKVVLHLPKPGLQIGAWASGPDVSADGNMVTFVSDRVDPFNYDLYVMKLTAGQPKPLGVTEVSRYNQNPVMDVSGKRILFLAGTETGAGSRPIYSLIEVDIATRKSRRIAGSGLFTDPSRWDGK